ncbi:hypothetical protein J2T39_003391, partial [Pseudomonas citronellolis]|nr:hypothetical protein [Pseudomonas citronellolis]
MRPTDFPRALGAEFESTLSPALSRKRERGLFVP